MTKRYIKDIIWILFITYNYLYAQSLTDVKILPSNIDVTSQSSVSFNVDVSNIVGLHAASITIEFDNNYVSYDSFINGNFLQNNNGGFSVYKYITLLPNNSNPTSIKIDLAILGAGTSSGTGTLFGLKFIPKNSGSCALNISNYSLKDLNSDPILVNVYSSNINIFSNIKTKVFLQGPFNGTQMTNSLNISKLLPVKQPYGVSPWNYNGNEEVSASFFSTNSNIVDWILLELRDKNDYNQVIARRAAFLTQDGNIMDIDGSNQIHFDVKSDLYYLVIYHRNHLAIMTASHIQINYASSLYDFTDNLTKAFGNSPMANLGNGYFGMFSGDANGNGQVQNNDLESYWKLQNGQSGYKEGDFNLNGQVQNNDMELYWQPNNGKGSQIPLN